MNDSRAESTEGLTASLDAYEMRTSDDPDTADTDFSDVNPDAIIPRVDLHLMPILALSVVMVYSPLGDFHVRAAGRRSGYRVF